jgi:DNA-directed RNA polymerase subunit RPC12/RpoP
VASCPNCGKPVSEDMSFCPECGHRLIAEEKQPRDGRSNDKLALQADMEGTAPILYKWDGRVRSPRELFRLLHDFLDKYGYEHKYHELSEKPGSIEGTANFWDALIGKKDYTKRRQRMSVFYTGVALISIGLITVGVAIATDVWTASIIGVVLLIAGIALMVTSRRTTALRKYIKLHVEGETYRARAAQLGMRSSEVLDVVSSCRVVFEAKVGNPQEGDYGVSKLTTDEEEWGTLQKEFRSLLDDFERIQPRIQVPET